MAMEVRRTIADAHDQAILCVAYNAQRREIFTGSQDATIKAWASEAGTLERTLVEPGRATAHAGWVTGLAFAPEVRVLFSCSIDGRILAWSFKGELLQKEKVGGKDLSEVAAKGPNGPLYCLAWDARRGHVVAGLTYTPHVRPTEDEPAPLPPAAGPTPRGRASTAAAAAAASAAAAAAAASHAAGREIGGCLPTLPTRATSYNI